jgi:TonB family protein
MVRLAPHLVEALCELARALKDKTHAQTEISGLLFGKSQDAMLTAEALKTFKDSSGPRSDLARRERMEKAFIAAMTLANEDPEFATFKLLGWFSLRGGGGLINSDIEFHNRHFKNTEEVALIIWREGDTQITTELYAAVDGGKLATEDYRWSSVRLSTELRHVSQPVDLVMRVRMNDDLYLRTYGVPDGRERKDEWKRIADSAKRTILSLLPGRAQSSVVYPEDLPLPPPSGTAKRSFESRTLFRGSDAVPVPPVPVIPPRAAAVPPTAAPAKPAAPSKPVTTTVPKAPVPTTTAPTVTAPIATVPAAVTTPAVAAPKATVPTTTAPTVTAPKATVPALTTPPVTAPPPAALLVRTAPSLPLPPPTRTTEIPAARVPYDVNRTLRPKPVPEVSGLPMVIQRQKPEPKRTPWFSMAMVFVLCSAVTFGVMALRNIGSGDGKISQIMRVLFPGSDLELRAASHGDSLWISWNRRNPVVAAASSAVLSVTDGPRHFERKLDASQVADGEVKYTPVSGDVTFHLRVYGADQSIATGSLRVLDATGTAPGDAKVPLDLSNPTPADANAANKTISIPPVETTANHRERNVEPPVRNAEAASNKANPPALPPPLPVPTSTPAASKPAAETPKATQRQPVVTVTQPQQQQPAKTAQQQPAPVVPTAPKPATPRPTTSSSAPLTSNTSINGWDASPPDNKPAGAPQQQAQQPVSPSDSKTMDFIGPKVLLQVMPNTRGLTPGSVTEVTRVEVEVRLDADGHVTRAILSNPNVKSQLGAAALAAAKQWTFQPATLRGQHVPSDHTIVFEFRPEDQ